MKLAQKVLPEFPDLFYFSSCVNWLDGRNGAIDTVNRLQNKKKKSADNFYSVSLSGNVSFCSWNVIESNMENRLPGVQAVNVRPFCTSLVLPKCRSKASMTFLISDQERVACTLLLRVHGSFTLIDFRVWHPARYISITSTEIGQIPQSSHVMTFSNTSLVRIHGNDSW